MAAHKNNGRAKGERHVRIPHWILDCPKWRMLASNDKIVWVEALRRYNGSNNGFLALPSRLLADRMNVGKTTVARCLERLITFGFVEVTVRSSFSNKTRKATEYRLTHLPCDRTGQLASKLFMRPASDCAATVPPAGQHGPATGRHGPMGGTEQSHQRDRSSSPLGEQSHQRDRESQFSPSTVPPAGHI